MKKELLLLTQEQIRLIDYSLSSEIDTVKANIDAKKYVEKLMKKSEVEQ